MGLAQLGVTAFGVVCLSELAVTQLDSLVSALPRLDCLCVSPSRLTAILAAPDNRNSLVCAHVCTADDVSAILQLVPRGVPLVMTGQRTSFHSLDRPAHFQGLHHRTLGGLTSARVTLCLSGHGNLEQSHISSRRSPLRPLAAFLEPAVRLSAHRPASPSRTDCWYPLSAKCPYPWPWSWSPRWVETSSVFFKNHLIQRPLTEKELAQLLDLRMDWTQLVPLLLSWCDGWAPPLRFVVESILCCLHWLRDLFDYAP